MVILNEENNFVDLANCKTKTYSPVNREDNTGTMIYTVQEKREEDAGVYSKKSVNK